VEPSEAGRPPRKGRTNSDVSQLDFNETKLHMTETPATIQSVLVHDFAAAPKSHSRKDSTSDSLASDATLLPGHSGHETDVQRPPSPPPPAENLQDILATSSLPPTVLSSPALRAVNDAAQQTANSSPAHRPSHRSTRNKTARPAKKPGPPPVSAFEGTIARATVDTTLAVIPAEAFKKLTRKFPKASGSIVQVVLERFSRVTFMTGKADAILTL
jgi:lysophospholipid hydrolase